VGGKVTRTCTLVRKCVVISSVILPNFMDPAKQLDCWSVVTVGVKIMNGLWEPYIKLHKWGHEGPPGDSRDFNFISNLTLTTPPLNN